ncbi:MAG: isoprenyl transferase [Cytophagaceae bacterium]|jgi:undecaprenyl diphosphate synthase|nr:isoprenyl transferase [Cytophagaceae bacterium]
MSIKEKLNADNIPQHIAVIMDGNGRWAKKKGALRIFGHQSAVKSVREIVEGCGELGVKHLTLYAFSTENWNRPKEEIQGLMQLLVDTLMSEVSNLHKNNVRLNTIGNFQDLPDKCQQQLKESIKLTSGNTGLEVILALSYSGRWDIMQAVNSLLDKAKLGEIAGPLSEDQFAACLSTANRPDPELMIRTSGEMRISNFLLWQLAYSELFITEVLWPDFRKKDLYDAIHHYQKRERRFGLTSEQLSEQKS